MPTARAQPLVSIVALVALITPLALGTLCTLATGCRRGATPHPRTTLSDARVIEAPRDVGPRDLPHAPVTELDPAEHEALLRVARATFDAIRARNMRSLALLGHPVAGVRFSPYGHVDLDVDVVIDPTEFLSAYVDRTPRVWGSRRKTARRPAGSGEIEQTFREYFDEFVFDRDFGTAQPRRWTAVERLREGYDPRIEVVQWEKTLATLQLLFVAEPAGWYLVGVVHSESMH